mgnify:CR=1 FL=1
MYVGLQLGGMGLGNSDFGQGVPRSKISVSPMDIFPECDVIRKGWGCTRESWIYPQTFEPHTRAIAFPELHVRDTELER